jgi:hypothetical protein
MPRSTQNSTAAGLDLRLLHPRFQPWCDLHDAPMTGTSDQPHPLARAQALDTWVVGRERAIAKLICEAEALEEYEFTKEAACLWHAVFRLRESARRERAEAAALQAAWDKCGKNEKMSEGIEG